MNDDRFAPCPFCGTERTKLHAEHTHINKWLCGAVVVCECGASGPPGTGKSAIIMACALWNQRKAPFVKPLYASNDYESFVKEEKQKGLMRAYWKDLPNRWKKELARRRNFEESLRKFSL